jgi:hypothetical protein
MHPNFLSPQITKNSIIQFPIRRVANAAHSKENVRYVKKYLTDEKRVFKHAYLNLTNFVVDTCSVYDDVEDVLKTAISNNVKLSLEVPNNQTLGDATDIKLHNIITYKYNKSDVNLYYIYHLNDCNSKAHYYSVSYHLHGVKDNIGIHLKMDTFGTDNETRDKFVDCCSLALINCNEDKKNIRLILEMNDTELYKKVCGFLSYYGQDVHYKIKLVETPYCSIDKYCGYEVLTLTPLEESWCHYMTNIFLERNVH